MSHFIEADNDFHFWEKLTIVLALATLLLSLISVFVCIYCIRKRRSNYRRTTNNSSTSNYPIQPIQLREFLRTPSAESLIDIPPPYCSLMDHVNVLTDNTVSPNNEVIHDTRPQPISNSPPPSYRAELTELSRLDRVEIIIRDFLLARHREEPNGNELPQNPRMQSPINSGNNLLLMRYVIHSASHYSQQFTFYFCGRQRTIKNSE